MPETGCGRGTEKLVVRLTVGGVAFDVALGGGLIAAAVVKALPFDSVAQRWGEEIYFDVPVRLANTTPTREVKVGDIAYWPDGPSLCIFFGKTPASRGPEPRAGSDVTVIGRTDADPSVLRGVKDGATIRLVGRESVTRPVSSSGDVKRHD